MWHDWAWLTVAGAAGTLARYGVSGWAQPKESSGWFPWGTFAVNMIGCFLFGLIWAALVDKARFDFSPEVRLFILVGFMGAFTTFSTFAFETCRLLQDGQWGYAVINLLCQNLFGIVLLLSGVALGRLL